MAMDNIDPQATVAKVVRYPSERGTMIFVAKDARGMTLWVGEFNAPDGVVDRALVNRTLKKYCGGKTYRDTEAA